MDDFGAQPMYPVQPVQPVPGTSPTKVVKRSVKVLVNLLGALLAGVLLVLVGATQHSGDVPVGGDGAWDFPASSSGACRLGAGACAYAYVLGGVSLLLALGVVALTLAACALGRDAAVIVDFSLHAFHALWWFIGVAVLGAFAGRASARGAPDPAARVLIVLVALAAFLLYAVSLATNVCCCIARYKHEDVSMYV